MAVDLSTLSDEQLDAYKSLLQSKQSSLSPPEKTLAGFAGNILPSAGNLVGNVYNAVRHPIDTVSALADTAAGVGNQGLAALGVKQTPESQKTIDKAVALEDALKQRYGGVQNIKDTLYSDPVGAAADISAVLGGGGALLKGAGAVADTANAGRIAGGLRTAGKASEVASTVTNPATLPSAVAKIGLKAAARPFIKNALRIPGKVELHGSDPVSAALDGRVPGYTPKAIETNAKAGIDSAEARLQAAATKAGNQGIELSLKPPRDVVNERIANAQQYQGEPTELYPLRDFVSEVRPNSVLASHYPPGSNSQIQFGVGSPYRPPTPTRIGSPPVPVLSERQFPTSYIGARRRLNEEYSDFFPGQNPLFKKPPEQSRVANSMSHAMGEEIKTKIPGAAPALKDMSDQIPLMTAAKKIQEAPGYGQQLIDKFSRPTGALAPILFGLAKEGLLGGVGAAGLQAVASSPTAKIIAARGLNAAGNLAPRTGRSVSLLNAAGRYGRQSDEEDDSVTQGPVVGSRYRQ